MAEGVVIDIVCRAELRSSRIGIWHSLKWKNINISVSSSLAWTPPTTTHDKKDPLIFQFLFFFPLWQVCHTSLVVLPLQEDHQEDSEFDLRFMAAGNRAGLVVMWVEKEFRAKQDAGVLLGTIFHIPFY